MKTKISTENPFPPKAPHSLVWQYLNDNQIRGSFLDYGAHDGKILKILSDRGFVTVGVGLDANRAVVQNSSKHLPDNVTLKLILKNSPLEFDDDTFDVITILGVIEHVHNQSKLLSELYRVLKPGGRILVIVPGKNFFSFLDLGNWKFIFPRLHKLYYEITHSKEEYKKRYIICENGLIGDIEVEKSWHQHFSPYELRSLMEDSGFSFLYSDGRGLFFRLIVLINLITLRIFNFFFKKLLNLDSQLFSQDEIMICCSKPTSEYES